MKCLKMKSKGAIRLVPITDRQLISNRMAEGYEAIMVDGKPLIIDFNGQQANENTIRQDAVDLLKLIDDIDAVG